MSNTISVQDSYRNYLEQKKYGDTTGAVDFSGADETQKTQKWDAVFVDKDDNGLNMDSFLKLMVTQLTNQDFMNPVDDTQYVTQLAQFATMQQMQELASYQKTNYAISLVGKNITAAKFGVAGNLIKETGVIQKVSLVDNSYEVTVNGKNFTLDQIMEINDNKTGSSSGSDTDKQAYLLSLMGKNVEVKTTDEDGKTVNVQGVVNKVSSEDGKYQVQIGDKWYPLDNVISVDGEEPDIELDPDKVSELAAMVGKEVTVKIKDEDGDPDEKTGRVTKISTKGGEYRLMIGDEWYLMSDVVNVRESSDTRNVWYET